MRIVLVFAGVLDPKWPIAPLRDGALPERSGERLILSPFEEAALEIALRIREGLGGKASLGVLVCGGAGTEKFARTIAAYRPDHISRLDLPAERLWDAGAVGGAVAAWLEASGSERAPGLLLLPRELGDCDDGALPPYLAGLLGLPFFGLAQDVRINGGAVELMREQPQKAEWLRLDRPILASVTNDRRNRLRRPLMKNVMMARQADFPLVPAAMRIDAGLSAAAVPAPARDRISGPCRRLGGSIEEQVSELAAFLIAEARQ